MAGAAGLIAAAVVIACAGDIRLGVRDPARSAALRHARDAAVSDDDHAAATDHDGGRDNDHAAATDDDHAPATDDDGARIYDHSSGHAAADHHPSAAAGSTAIQRRLRRWLDLLAYRRCEPIIVPSEMLADQLAAEGIEAMSIGVAQPGCDVPESLGSAAGLVGDLRSGRRAALLCVANWVERKGILDLLDAVAGLDDDLVTSHLVGDENVDERFRARVVERRTRPDLMGRVERHGVVEPARVPDYYEGADAFVLPSTEEPYGMVYAEAMVAGLPVVGWRAGNLPNLVDDGVEGRLIPVGDVVALRSAPATLAVDDELRRALGAAARSRAERSPTWDQTARVFFAICRHALAAAGSTTRRLRPPMTDVAAGSL